MLSGQMLLGQMLNVARTNVAWIRVANIEFLWWVGGGGGCVKSFPCQTQLRLCQVELGF